MKVDLKKKIVLLVIIASVFVTCFLTGASSDPCVSDYDFNIYGITTVKYMGDAKEAIIDLYGKIDGDKVTVNQVNVTLRGDSGYWISLTKKYGASGLDYSKSDKKYSKERIAVVYAAGAGLQGYATEGGSAGSILGLFGLDYIMQQTFYVDVSISTNSLGKINRNSKANVKFHGLGSGQDAFSQYQIKGGAEVYFSNLSVIMC